MKESWLAIIDRNLISLTFSKTSFSQDIRYWVKKYENGKFHVPVSTGNSYALRNFEIYDENLTSCIIEFGFKNKWKCIEIRETSLDASGSLCFVKIADPNNKVKEIRMHGRYNNGYGGFQQSIKEDFYLTAIMLFLILLNKHISWEDLQNKDADLYNDINERNGIPQNIFKEAERINNRIDLMIHLR